MSATTPFPSLVDRARAHAALGDQHRLGVVDSLWLSDRSPGDLATELGLPSNLLAHHLDVLEGAGLIGRRPSQGDRRRRYLHLRHETLPAMGRAWKVEPRRVLFVCTHNSARSQLASVIWQARTGLPGESAGRDPAARVHEMAVSVARRHGLDRSRARPRGYQQVVGRPDLVVSVCDLAREAGLPFRAPTLHWSVPDPVPVGRAAAFAAVFGELEERVEQLAAAVT